MNKELWTEMQPKRNTFQKVIQSWFQLFSHTCRMNDSLKVKLLVFSVRLTMLERAIAKGDSVCLSLMILT